MNRCENRFNLICALALASLVASACTQATSTSKDAGASLTDAAETDGTFQCPVPLPTLCPSPSPRYADVAPVIARRCVVCHDGAPNGPWPLIDYQDVTDWWDTVRDDLIGCSMPPPDGGTSMTSEERTAILTWILCGFPP